MEPVIGYCVKCHEKKEMKDPVEIQMPSTCGVCGTGMFKIMANPKPEPPPAPAA